MRIYNLIAVGYIVSYTVVYRFKPSIRKMYYTMTYTCLNIIRINLVIYRYESFDYSFTRMPTMYYSYNIKS